MGDLVVAISLFLLLAAVAGSVVIYFRGVGTVLYNRRRSDFGNFLFGKAASFGLLRIRRVAYRSYVRPVVDDRRTVCGMRCSRRENRFWWGIAVGLLVTNILYSHSVLDAQADAQMEKLTLARLLKGRNAVLAASAVFNFVPFLLIIAGVSVGMLPAAYLCVLVLLPIAVFCGVHFAVLSTDSPKKSFLKNGSDP